MASYADSGTRSLSQIKPIATSEAAELEHSNMREIEVDIQQKLVLRPWRTRFWDQLTVLTYKQILVYVRNGRATTLRLLAPLFFMFLLWLLNIAVRSDSAVIEAFENTPIPAINKVNGIPTCVDDVFLRSDPCWDFIYSPNTSAVANQIAEGMRLNNPGRQIPEDAVLGFTSLEAANEFLLANPERVLGGIHFLLDDNAVADPSPGPVSALNYVLQVNSTVRYFRARYQDPTFFASMPLQVAAEREIARQQWQAAGRDPTQLQWNVSVSQFAHPQVGDINIVGQAMGPFVFAANMFNFVLLLSSVVAEREKGLRQALKTAGMLDSAFWLSWAGVELAISVLFTLFTIAFGAMFQFDFFLHNSFGIIFLLFLLFQWAMISIAFLLSTFISKTSTAINLGFVIFILGWVLQVAVSFDFPYSPDNIDSSPVITAIFTLLPFAPLSKGTVDLGAASETTDDGITWSRRNSYCQDVQNPTEQDALYATAPGQYWNFECVFPLGTILAVLAIETLVYFILAIYLNNVLADENGVRKKPWYFLTLEYWKGGSGKKAHSSLLKGPRALRPPVPCPVADVIGSGKGDADVAAEEAAMKELLQHRTAGGADRLAATADTTNAVEVFGLQKAFGRGWCAPVKRICCIPFVCCRRRSSNSGSSSSSTAPKSGEFWAIKGSWFSIERDRVFCLLGPNGAGKTTTINCLTGVLPPTGGDALVYGESINSAGGVERIRSVMGVCPQFDVQWGELTGFEHMYIYGRVKGLPKAQVMSQGEGLLESVRLTAAGAQRTSTYSGGMRRRLSVAMSLLGDPLIVYLDEPTTGMDPISRRQVWDAIEVVKKGRAIVLTTHSMEEADILGDSIAIMARGRVRAYGSSLRLKQRFGSGYHLAVAIGSNGKNGAWVNGGKREDAAARAARKAEKQAKVDAVAALFNEELGVGPPEAGAGAYSVFLVPKSVEEKLPAFLQMLESRSDELSISDIQISLTSLEEVFLSIARRAELEAAEAEGRRTVEVRLEDGSILEVELGAEEAVQSSTNRRYAVKWVQDEAGGLSVASWKLVEGFRATDSTTSASTGSAVGLSNGGATSPAAM